ncbi:MAG: hypothetical protein O2913_07730 [Chloroflexi bacterium]|nr:hypothetical protein [Chloroflexota bacterium]
MAIAFPLRHYEAMTGWIGVLNIVPYLGGGLIVTAEWYQSLHWHWWVVSGIGITALLAAHALFHYQKKMDRLSDFDGAIEQLRQSEHTLEGIVNNLIAIRYVREHPELGAQLTEDFVGQEEQRKTDGANEIAKLVKYGRSAPLVGRRIEQQLAAPYATHMPPIWVS